MNTYMMDIIIGKKYKYCGKENCTVLNKDKTHVLIQLESGAKITTPQSSLNPNYLLCHIVNSNGSKWNGEEHDSIDKLIEVLNKYTLEEWCFEQYYANKYSDNIEDRKLKNHCPIDMLNNGNYHFFGNFEEVSHVFNIETNNPKIIDKLSKSIKNNLGWKKYYEKHLVKTGQQTLF